jgi:dolichol-phosphate mannosyltransferase
MPNNPTLAIGPTPAVNPTLAVVIPVYNEQDNLIPLLRDWQPLFQKTGVPYQAIFIDDGSADNSLRVLEQVNDPAIRVVTQSNSGHGSAILRGYRLALGTDPPGGGASGAEWVFQIDSDHQLDPAAFADLWNNRDRYDLLLAERENKDASFGRRLISGISRGIVHTLFGSGVSEVSSAVRDVNSPYRLMRGARLAEALVEVPAGSFAPNVLITAWFVLKKSRIFTTKTRPRGGALRRRSKLSAYILRGAIRSAFQTLMFRLR